jgi:thiamine-phosphate diphosphorylase
MIRKIYCPSCKTKLIEKFVEERKRLYCTKCESPLYENPIPATAAVVLNPDHQILLVKRKVEPKKGEWCLPGGFIELFESPEYACIRELKEETGLQAKADKLAGIYLSNNPIYKSVLVIGYSTKNIEGKLVAGDDSEETCYFDLNDRPPLAFKSHTSILEEILRQKNIPTQYSPQPLKDFGAYVITSADHVNIARKASQGGAKILQYRDKAASRKELLKTATEIQKITSEYNTKFIMNDYIDVALMVKADGVHLGQDDIPITQAREIVPKGFLIGVSTHSLEQAKEAEKQGADYIGIGPVFSTPTKEDYIPIGIHTVKAVLATVKIPAVAIGGLNRQNLPELIKIGVKNAAMVREYQLNTADVVKTINQLF